MRVENRPLPGLPPPRGVVTRGNQCRHMVPLQKGGEKALRFSREMHRPLPADNQLFWRVCCVLLRWQLNRCQAGSRRSRRLNKRKATLSAQRYQRQRALLRQAARTVGDCCHADGLARIAVGDVRELQTGVSLGKQTNQTSSQWPHEQFTRSLAETRRGWGWWSSGSARRIPPERVV